jgi:Kef-type K+ transport system membrane component KefB
LILATVHVFAELATCLKSPAVIGEPLAGRMQGPSLPGWMNPGETVRLLAESWPTRWIIGTALVPRGDAGLIFAELRCIRRHLDNQVHAGTVIVLAFTALLSPFVMKWMNMRFNNLPTHT